MADISSFIITFREALEVMLILGVVVGYLAATKQKHLLKQIYLGAVAGFILSIIAAFAFVTFIGEFEGFGEQVFEGTLFIIGALLVSILLIWMIKTRHGIKGVKENVLDKIELMEEESVFFLAMVVVFREGIEAVLFLSALSLENTSLAVGATIGIIVGIIVGYLIFKRLIKVDLVKMFAAISILLILFAAGMVLHSVGEFQEAGMLPILTEKAYVIDIPQNSDGTYPLLHEKGIVGGLAKDLFGYSPDPSILQLIGYFGYLVLMSAILLPKKRV